MFHKSYIHTEDSLKSSIHKIPLSHHYNCHPVPHLYDFQLEFITSSTITIKMLHHLIILSALSNFYITFFGCNFLYKFSYFKYFLFSSIMDSIHFLQPNTIQCQSLALGKKVIYLFWLRVTIQCCKTRQYIFNHICVFLCWSPIIFISKWYLPTSLPPKMSTLLQ